MCESKKKKIVFIHQVFALSLATCEKLSFVKNRGNGGEREKQRERKGEGAGQREILLNLVVHIKSLVLN